MSNYGNFLSPAKARLLPAESRERSISSHALRQAWHYIFDYCPKLLELYPPSGKEFLDPFLDDTEANGIALNWKIFFLIIDQHSKKGTLTQELCAELITAATIAWTISDFTKFQSIYVIEKYFGIAILGSKAPCIDQEKQFRVFKHNACVDSTDIYYSVSVDRDPKNHDNWELIKV